MWAAEAYLKRRLLLSKNYEHPDEITEIPKGTKVTITKGREQKYCLWGNLGLWDIDEMYIDEDSIKIISEN
jgi:hypothetical protein